MHPVLSLLIAAYFRDPLGTQQMAVASQVIASRTIRELRGMPALVRAMAGELGQEISPESRMLLTMGLAYLVGPVDLVRDDLPGGLGFVDDAIMMWAIVGAAGERHGTVLPGAQRAREAVRVLAMALPTRLVPLLQAAADDAVATLHGLAGVPPGMLERATEQYMADPIGMTRTGVQAMLGRPHAGPNPGWNGGGDTFTIPGGGVGYAGDGMLAYSFDDGDFLAL